MKKVPVKIPVSHKEFLKSDGNMGVKLNKILKAFLKDCTIKHSGEKVFVTPIIEDVTYMLLMDVAKKNNVSAGDVIRQAIDSELSCVTNEFSGVADES